MRFGSYKFGAGIGPVVLGCLLMASCAPKSSVVIEPPKPSNGSGMGGSETSPAPGDVGKPAPKTFPAPTLNPKIFAVDKPQTDGWVKPESSLAELGGKMDDAFANLKSALGHADTVFDVAGATMQSRGDIKVKDPSTFSIDYYTPGTEATRNRIVADGQKRFEFYDEKWTEKPLPVKHNPLTMSDADLAAWPRDFYRNMFSNFSDDHTVWKPLFEALESGKAGYVVHLETKKEKVNDKDRPIYRVIATRKEDGAEFQVTVDGIRYLPVTVKSVMNNDKGGQDKRLWTCQWAFNGPFSSKEFIVPSRP